jgi:Uma2 family endonuclease
VRPGSRAGLRVKCWGRNDFGQLGLGDAANRGDDPGDMRLRIPATGRYVYPDGSVVCGKPEFEDEKRDTLLNPTVVIEVLSDSSEADDRGDKFAQYQTVPSIRAYVLASQKATRIEVFTRQADGSWVLRIYGAGERASLSAVGCEIAVDGVYQGVFTTREGG